MGNHMGLGERRYHDQRNPRSSAQFSTARILGEERWRDMIVSTFGIIPTDDGAIIPVLTIGDSIHHFRYQRFTELGVRITLMVIVSDEVSLHGFISGSIQRSQTILVLKHTLDVENATRTELLIVDIRKELVVALQVLIERSIRSASDRFSARLGTIVCTSSIGA